MKRITVAALVLAVSAGSAFAGGYGGSHGGMAKFGPPQHAEAYAKNVAKQKAGATKLQITGAVGVAANVQKGGCKCAGKQTAYATAKNNSTQIAHRAHLQISGSVAAAVNVR